MEEANMPAMSNQYKPTIWDCPEFFGLEPFDSVTGTVWQGEVLHIKRIIAVWRDIKFDDLFYGVDEEIGDIPGHVPFATYTSLSQLSWLHINGFDEFKRRLNDWPGRMSPYQRNQCRRLQRRVGHFLWRDDYSRYERRLFQQELRRVATTLLAGIIPNGISPEYPEGLVHVTKQAMPHAVVETLDAFSGFGLGARGFGIRYRGQATVYLLFPEFQDGGWQGSPRVVLKGGATMDEAVTVLSDIARRLSAQL